MLPMTRCSALPRRLLLIAFALSGSALAEEDKDPKAAEFEAVSDADTMVMVPMRDGVRLATDVYLPKDREGPVPTVFVKTPYDFNEIRGTSLAWALEAVKRGYAYVVQNERGRYYSEGEWEILGRPQTDGYDSLSWIAEQDWSDGRVATLGCSSTAEWQMALAALDHPAHAAMVPMASGAGIGHVGEFQEQGNWYKGGVHQTLFTVWLYSVQQDLRPRFPDGLPQETLQRLRKMYDLAADMPEQDWAKKLRELPAVDWLETAGGNEGPGADFLRRRPDDPGWYEGGLYHDDMDFGVPAYWHNSWFDVSQGPNLALFNHVRENASDPAVRDGQYVIVAPTLHCGFYRTPEFEDLKVG
jgi:putative CocE/NonD family hydrolase